MKIKIELERYVYFPGNNIEGKVIITADKKLEINKIEFYSVGEEIVQFRQLVDFIQYRFHSENIFFTKPLFHFLYKFYYENRNGSKLQIPEGITEVPFMFVLSDNALESYNGKNVKIQYSIIFNLKRKFNKDIKNVIQFVVLSNPKLQASVYEWKMKNIIKENDQNDYKIEIINNKSIQHGNISGIICINNDLMSKKIRNCYFNLVCIEYARAGLIFTKDQQKLERIKNFLGIRYANSWSTVKKFHQKINFDVKEKINFDVKVPFELKQPYIGKYSSIIWIIDIKIDVSFGKDIHIISRLGRALKEHPTFPDKIILYSLRFRGIALHFIIPFLTILSILHVIQGFLQDGTQGMKWDIEIYVFITCIAAISFFYFAISVYHLVRYWATYFSPKMCRKCKLINDYKSKFCISCGVKLVSNYHRN